MASPKGFEMLSVPSTGAVGCASIPAGADNAIIRLAGTGTVLWREDASGPNASMGIAFSSADGPFRIANLTTFKVINPLGAAAINLALAYYEGFDLL